MDEIENMQPADNETHEIFESFYERYHSQVYRYVISRVAPSLQNEYVDDIVQAVFTKAFIYLRKAGQNNLVLTRPFPSYLLQITQLVLHDLSRRDSRIFADEFDFVDQNDKARWKSFLHKIATQAVCKVIHKWQRLKRKQYIPVVFRLSFLKKKQRRKHKLCKSYSVRKSSVDSSDSFDLAMVC